MSENVMRTIAYELSNSAGETIIIREEKHQIESYSHIYPADTLHPLIRQSDALAKLAEKDAEIARLQKIVGVFSAKIAEYASEGWDVPAPECVDLLDEAGVIEWGTFDPEVHDRAMFDGCDAGDPIWTMKGSEA